jgi:hypothetical protein
MRLIRYRLLFSLTIFLAGPFDLQSQILADEAPRPLYYERTQRITNFWKMRNFQDVFHSDKYLLGRDRFSGNIAYQFQRVLISDDSKGQDFQYRSAMSFFLRWRFYEQISVNTTFYLDFNKKAAARWISDYTYTIGRYNWRPYKFNFGYENYQNNKYTDNWDTFLQKATEGFFFASYNYPLPDMIMNKLRLDSTTSIRFSPFARYALRYRDELERVHYEGKPCIGISARITLFWNIYIEGAVYHYFNPMYRQLPWDPDFTYGFGYFDWRSFRLSLTYGNWAVNRFGRNSFFPHYGFLDGQFRVIFNWIW